MSYPGLHGMVDQLPVGKRWTAERRQAWIDALITVLDFSLIVYTPKADATDAEPDDV